MPFRTARRSTRRQSKLLSAFRGEAAGLCGRGVLCHDLPGHPAAKARALCLGGLENDPRRLSGQVIGDKAPAATIELQLSTGFSLTRFGLNENVSSRFYLSYGWGETRRNQPQSFAERIALMGGGGEDDAQTV
jgi:hypothetical protein